MLANRTQAISLTKILWRASPKRREERVEKGQEGGEELSITCYKGCETAEGRLGSSGSEKTRVHMLCVCFTKQSSSFQQHHPCYVTVYFTDKHVGHKAAFVCTH